MPSPFDCNFPLSPWYVYTGNELNVTCFIVLLRLTKPIVPFTPAPRDTVVTELLTRRGGHVGVHAAVHLIFAPLSELNTYIVRDE